MVELQREDYKQIIALMGRSWLIVDKTGAVKDESLLLENFKGRIPEISFAYKIRNHELVSIFMDSSMGTTNGDYYIYIFVIDVDGDFTYWGLFPMVGSVFNAVYADEVINYRNGEQLLYKCSEEYLDLQSYAELQGNYEQIPNIVLGYLSAMVEEVLSEDFSIITSRDEEIKWQNVEVESEENEVKEIIQIKNTWDVAREGHWLEIIGQ